MTQTFNHRRAIGAVTAALVLSTAGSAAARPFDLDSAGSFVPAGYAAHYEKANVPPSFAPRHMKGLPEMTGAPVATATPRAVVSHPAPGGGSDLVYVLVGGVVFAGLGGAFAAGRHQRARTTASRPTIAT